MKVKIIASKPISGSCSGIDKYIGKEFYTYIDEIGDLMVCNKGGNDFLLFDGEYEVVEA